MRKVQVQKIYEQSPLALSDWSTVNWNCHMFGTQDSGLARSPPANRSDKRMLQRLFRGYPLLRVQRQHAVEELTELMKLASLWLRHLPSHVQQGAQVAPASWLAHDRHPFL